MDARFCRRQGHPGSPGAGAFIRSCMPHGVRHPGGETDRQSPCRGRAARILARTIRMPPVSSIWIPGRRWAPALGHPTVRNPVGGHARERHGGAGRRSPDHQGAGGYGCPGASILYLGITLSDERGEGERAHCRRSVRLAAGRIDPSVAPRSFRSGWASVHAPCRAVQVGCSGAHFRSARDAGLVGEDDAVDSVAEVELSRTWFSH